MYNDDFTLVDEPVSFFHEPEIVTLGVVSPSFLILTLGAKVTFQFFALYLAEAETFTVVLDVTPTLREVV